MQFHKKHGVFEACKKVCEDFFDTLKKVRALKSSHFFAAFAFLTVAKGSLPPPENIVKLRLEVT